MRRNGHDHTKKTMVFPKGLCALSLLSALGTASSFSPFYRTATRTAAAPGSAFAFPPTNSRGSLFLFSVTTTETDDVDRETVETIRSSCGTRTVTLVGTAHLSQASNEQVERIIATIKPDAVMVELDVSRLERIGYDDVDDLGYASVVTVDDVAARLREEQLLLKKKTNTSWIDLPGRFATNLFLDAFTAVARQFLTGMYDNMAEKMENDAGPGGEFRTAIEAGQTHGAKLLILGDRASESTIRRGAELAVESGDPFGVLNRLNEVNRREIDALEDRVRNELQRRTNGSDDDDGDEVRVVDNAEVTVAMMETMKSDTTFRTRLFEKLEQEVPVFTEAFLRERDYIMSESIIRETRKEDIATVVGVVGLAHVPGIKKKLQKSLAKTN